MRTIILSSRLYLAIVIICFTFTVAFSATVQSKNSTVTGTIRNQQKEPVKDASISIFSGVQMLLGSAVTDDQGQFKIDNLPVGTVEIIIQHPSYQVVRNEINLVENGNSSPLEFSLTPNNDTNNVGIVVTTTINAEQEAFEATQQIKSVSSVDMQRVPGLTLPQLITEEVGIRLEQNVPGQSSINIRGLTAQRVVTLIDGVRFNNSTFPQASVNLFVGLIEPGIARRVEVIYGPNSSLYGSDSLGGTINVISQKPTLYDNGIELHGQIDSFFGSADLSSGGSFKLNLGGKKAALLVSGFGRSINDLRTGQGVDSHSGITTFFGLPSTTFFDNIRGSGYATYGGFGKFLYKPTADQQISLFYNHTDQRGIDRTNDLLGISPLKLFSVLTSPQILDFFYARYTKQNIGFIDSIAGTFSLNRQIDEAQLNIINNPQSESRRNRALGYSIQATTHLGTKQFFTFGGDLYAERADDTLRVQITNNPARKTFPNGSLYRSYGAFIQDSVDLIPNKLRINGGLRYSAFFFKTFARDNVATTAGPPTAVDSSIRVDDVTFNFEAIAFIKKYLGVVGNISRGFRAPNILDLGTVGRTSFGAEVLSGAAAALNGEIGTSLGLNAKSTGKLVSSPKPENLINYEIGLRFQKKRVTSSFTFFNTNLNDLISKRALILPQGAVGKVISGQPITQQDPVTGAVGSNNQPIVVTVNVGEARIYGIETSARINIKDGLILSGNFFYLRGKDKNPNLFQQPAPGEILIRKAPDAPDLPGGLPPANGFLSLRYEPAGKHYWVEAYSNLASFQDRLSSVDLADSHIGATRTRTGIITFFSSFGVLSGLVGKRADGQQVLLATGETVQQIADRVLGQGINKAPFSLSTPGYATFNLRGGFQLGERSTITIILENLLDKNYRIHGSGVDAPGRNLIVRYSWRF